jgi:hypothetical protein
VEVALTWRLPALGMLTSACMAVASELRQRGSRAGMLRSGPPFLATVWPYPLPIFGSAPSPMQPLSGA